MLDWNPFWFRLQALSQRGLCKNPSHRCYLVGQRKYVAFSGLLYLWSSAVAFTRTHTPQHLRPVWKTKVHCPVPRICPKLKRCAAPRMGLISSPLYLRAVCFLLLKVFLQSVSKRNTSVNVSGRSCWCNWSHVTDPASASEASSLLWEIRCSKEYICSLKIDFLSPTHPEGRGSVLSAYLLLETRAS